MTYIPENILFELKTSLHILAPAAHPFLTMSVNHTDSPVRKIMIQNNEVYAVFYVSQTIRIGSVLIVKV